MAKKKAKVVKEAKSDFSTEKGRRAHIKRKLAKRAKKKKLRMEKKGRYAEPVVEESKKPKKGGKK